MTKSLPVPQSPQHLVSIAQSKAPRGSVPGPGHLLPFGPCWTPIPREERQAGGDRQMDLDRLRQSFSHGQAEGGRSSSLSGGLWAPRSWLRILAKLPHQLWGRCSCLNPVPQERHLLVVGTMEMAAGFWTWLRGASFRGRREGSSQIVSGAGEWFALPPQSFPSSDCSHIHQVKNRPSQKCSQSHWERKGLRG